MWKVFVLLVFCAIFMVTFGKHIHPRSTILMEEETDDANIASDIENIRHIKQSRFVPVNNVFFFQRYPPCDEGFERDLLGICREVWE